MKHNYADCTIQWRDTQDLEAAIISLNGTDNANIFFTCNSEEEFAELTKEDNGEDFRIISYDFLETY